MRSYEEVEGDSESDNYHTRDEYKLALMKLSSNSANNRHGACAVDGTEKRTRYMTILVKGEHEKQQKRRRFKKEVKNMQTSCCGV